MTQKFNNPIFVNPALTGNGEKLNRLSFFYRDQWRSVPVPYSSTFINYDRKLIDKKSNLFSGGIQFFYDKAGEGSLSTFNPNITLSYGRYFNSKRQLISVGLQTGYLQRTIKMSDLQFDSQFGINGFDPSAASGEIIDASGGVITLGVGINFMAKLGPRSRSKLDIGFATFNPHQPNISLAENGSDKRPIRYTTYASAEVFLANKWSITPSFHFQAQEKAREYHSSLYFSYYTQAKAMDLKWSLGGGYRINDAALAYTGIKLNDVQVGFSYDINTSSFKDATNHKGGFEVSLQYEFERKKVVEIDTIIQIDTIIIAEEDTTILMEEDSSEEGSYDVVEEPDYETPVINEPEQEVEQKDPEQLDYIRKDLPLSLFFDNDHPDPNTWNTRTEINYLDSYNEYLTRRDIFARNVGRETADAWFAKVEAGKVQFDQMVGYVLELLEQGYQVKLTLKGYTSPLANSQYNTFLSMRRIESVKHYLQQTQNGVLQAYFDSGVIKLVENPFGESFSPANVSDDYYNKRKSVYSKEASFERRVDVIAIEAEK